MLTYLHVKNFAVVEDVEVEFGDSLNILTGETGVGKSVIIGSINMALGAKMGPDMIRAGESYAFVEMAFSLSEQEWELLKEFDIIPEDNQLIISRKLVNGRSSCRVNGETVTVGVLKKIAGVVIDIHGQHDHQSLLYPENHLDIVDRFAGSEAGKVKSEVAGMYNEYCSIKREYEEMEISGDDRQREIDFLEYEINEIENANLMEGEEEKLEEEYKRLSNSERILESMSKIYGLTGSEDNAAASLIGEALMYINQVVTLDDKMIQYQLTLTDIDSILSDFNRDVSDYVNDYTFDAEEYTRIEERLDAIRRLYAKYGGTYELTMKHYEEICKKRDRYIDYEANMKALKKKLELSESSLLKTSKQLSDIRNKAAASLKELINSALVELNFPARCFDIEVRNEDRYSANGMDYIEFMIAANQGEQARPLAKVASGGELSRVMLAIKSVLAESDSIHTLIFDEIDTGISGRTAQKVSEKLAQIAKSHQVICITHLAQIASMADNHYVIEKTVYDGRTRTDIRPLDETEITGELARILGGAEITDSVLENAKEMKILANKWKECNL